MRTLKHVCEKLFFVIERVVTAALYPLCLLRQRLGDSIRVPILMYHQVGGVPTGPDRVSPERFERQIRAIRDAGYRVVPLSDVVRSASGPPPTKLRRCVVLTFDDGYRGQFAFAYPILRWNRLPATFFVTAGFVGSDTYFPHLSFGAVPAEGQSSPPLAWLPLSWDEVEEMAENGIDFGSHAVSHRSLGRLSEDEAAFEALGSREILERRLGRRVDLFAYPFGSRAYGDFDPDLEDILGRSGYRAACTTVVGRSGPDADPLALPRIPMEEGDGPFRVRCKLAGAYDWVGTVKSFWQRLAAREERVDTPLPAAAGVGLGYRR